MFEMGKRKNAAAKAETTPLTREEMDRLADVRQEVGFDPSRLVPLADDKDFRAALSEIEDDGTQSRGWVVVFNHAQEYIEEYTDLGWLSPDEVIAFLGKLFTHKAKRSLVRGGGGKNTTGLACHFEFGEEITSRYVGVNFEVANTEDRTKHCHVIIRCNKSYQLRFSTLMRMLYPFRPHVEPFKGGWNANVDYIWKRGKHEDKSETLYRDPVFFGNPASVGVKEDINEQIDELIGKGLRPSEIMAMGSRFANKQRSIEALFTSRLQANAPSERDVEVIYDFGETSTRKTRSAISRLEAAYPDADLSKFSEKARHCYVASSMENAFDNYEGQPVVIIEEFRSNMMPWREFLSIMDRYVNWISARYSNKLMLWEKLYINSTVAPEELYPSLIDPNVKKKDGTEYSERELKNKSDNKEQMYRRIREVVYHFVDRHYDKNKQPDLYYCEVSVRGDEYSGVLGLYKGKKQLFDMAEEFLRKRHPEDYETDEVDDEPLSFEELEELFGSAPVRLEDKPERRARSTVVQKVPKRLRTP